MIHIAAPFAGSLVGWRELLLFLMPVVGWTLDGHKYITIQAAKSSSARPSSRNLSFGVQMVDIGDILTANMPLEKATLFLGWTASHWIGTKWRRITPQEQITLRHEMMTQVTSFPSTNTASVTSRRVSNTQ